MGLLSTLASDDTIANERDSVGGNNILDSKIYPCKINTAYIGKAASGAMSLVVSLKTNTGNEIKQTLWMTSGTAKGGKNYYEQKDGTKQYLPGFTHANALALLSIGKEISELDTETKVMNVYSAEAKAEIPTKVEMVMDLIGKDINIGIIRQKVDKTRKNEVTGIYEATGETKEENEIDKIFRADDNMTTAEIRGKAEKATFYTVWEEKWSGKVKDKSKGTSATGTSGAPGTIGKIGTPNKKPVTSLFA